MKVASSSEELTTLAEKGDIIFAGARTVQRNTEIFGLIYRQHH